ncbi:MAG: flagellar basal-body rod protein FlgF [Rhodospirillales bacterium]|jgi:flagellar basal-body rod protein FlgF
MENPSYIAIAQMGALRRQLDVTANNVANISTPGYRSERLLFETIFSDMAGNSGLNGPGAKVAFAVDRGIWRDSKPGPVERTGNQFDIALVGPGYIAVQTESGVRYTRAGAFRPDAQGRLALANGAQLLGENGSPITIPAGETSVEIDRRGAITGKEGQIGRVRVVTFDNEQAMRRTGENLLTTDAEAKPMDDKQTKVAQGMIEGSNVQSVLEIAQMIELTRRYQSASRMIDQEQDRSRRTIEKLTRLS